MDKPKISVHKFSSCDGCQVQILSLEEELLQLADRVDIAFFAEATSRMDPGPYAVSFVEGSVSTPHEIERIKHIRDISDLVVSIGACGQSGGLQALRNWGDLTYYLNDFYTEPEHIDALPQSTAFHEHIVVDWEVPGCPPDQGQLKYVINSVLSGVKPNLPSEAVCLQCKRDGNVCVLVSQDQPCMGPITRTGCGALCPHQERDCYGCFGPQGGGNIDALGRRFNGAGLTPADVVSRLRLIYSWAEPFRGASLRWEKGAPDAPLPPQPHKHGGMRS
ncbi:NADH-quinone oxidoreductase subunit B family protein [Thiohalomonas denitrificans]|uniref:Coenzyme F420-reducing hydrogenase, gamma subunit n=1 Tax=Thiohalomonas denitrificans TaxID=415747 RepID=A0A1G5QBX4_9GAMM|nr:sulfhydrogenase subunit delta [Thiohalomonas denitrificans]SCZ59096.1 Coenzyme F420-reducing hydrogenase, gamma subunit [Thiohalomonas denitrificans]